MILGFRNLRKGLRIQKFTKEGIFISQWGSAGTSTGQFSGPLGIAVDNNYHVYVAEYMNNRIQKFTSTGRFITNWGIGGTNNGEFNHPAGIALDGDGNVYVADMDNHRIQKFSSSGSFIMKLVPSLFTLLTSIVPLCNSMICFVKAKPIPVL